MKQGFERGLDLPPLFAALVVAAASYLIFALPCIPGTSVAMLSRELNFVAQHHAAVTTSFDEFVAFIARRRFTALTSMTTRTRRLSAKGFMEGKKLRIRRERYDVAPVVLPASNVSVVKNGDVVVRTVVYLPLKSNVFVLLPNYVFNLESPLLKYCWIFVVPLQDQKKMTELEGIFLDATVVLVSTNPSYHVRREFSRPVLAYGSFMNLDVREIVSLCGNTLNHRWHYHIFCSGMYFPGGSIIERSARTWSFSRMKTAKSMRKKRRFFCARVMVWYI